MSEDESFGDDLDWDDPSVLATLDQLEQQAVASASAASAAPRAPARVPPLVPAKRPLAVPARNVQPILRPPQPPPAKRQRVNNPVVHPNPFHSKSNAAPAPMNVPDDDNDNDDMPEISVDESGYGVRQGASETRTALESWGEPRKQPQGLAQPKWTKQTVAQPPRAAPPPRAQAAPPRPPPIVHPPERPAAVASGSGMSDSDRKELESLRAERAKLLETVKETELERLKAVDALVGKNGEVSIIRNKLNKSEKIHLTQLEAERKTKRELEDRLAVKETELKRQLDNFAVESAFRRQEIETSAKRVAPSQWSSTNRARSNSVQAGGSMGPPPVPIAHHGSPSVGRSRITNGPSQRPPASTQAIALLGFQNSFDSPIGGGAARRSARAETMPPPPTGRGRGPTTPEKQSTLKGKGKILVEGTVEEEVDESVVLDSKGMSGWGAKGDGASAGGMDDSRVEDDPDDDEHEEDEWMGFMRDRMGDGGSVVAALFSHRTFVHFEADSINQPASTSQRSSTLAPSFARTASTARYGSFAAQPTGRLDVPAATPTPQAPKPTLHLLMSLRLPPGTPLATVTEYEDVCRDLSSILGQRPSLVNPANGNLFGVVADTTSHLARGVGTSLESLARILDTAGVVGPLISLLSLLASLILLFPPFALHFLNVPLSPAQILPPQGKHRSKLLALLARVVKRFGRPAPVVRAGEKSGRGGKARERTRRVRGVGAKPTGAVDKASDDERIELEPAKRIALLSAVVEVLEGLSWRITERAKDSFVDFLAADSAVATLLDPHQPVALLTSTTRFLSSLACQPNLFRPLVGIQFYDATDVRGSKFPLFDRLASLIVRNAAAKATHHQMFSLDMCLVSLVTSLLTKNSDALIYISGNASFLPELLDKVFKDTRLVWEYDGQAVSDSTMTLLRLVVARLSATVHLFYYLACAPKATVNITEYFTQSTFLGLHDRFNVAFGTLSFATLPDWAVGTPEGSRLTELGYLAQEIMEDVSPQEADEIESCFVSHDVDEPDELQFDEENISFSQG